MHKNCNFGCVILGVKGVPTSGGHMLVLRRGARARFGEPVSDVRDRSRKTPRFLKVFARRCAGTFWLQTILAAIKASIVNTFGS